MVLLREWQARRVVVTKHLIAFTLDKENEELILDRIPLAEITSLEEMIEKANNGSAENKTERKISLEDVEKSLKFAHAFQIHTMKNGFNSGRTYCLKTESDTDTLNLITELKAHAQVAREKMEAKSRFTRSQDRVRAVYS
jgi:hypothetical protein